jgi:hypothetical protein
MKNSATSGILMLLAFLTALRINLLRMYPQSVFDGVIPSEINMTADLI